MEERPSKKNDPRAGSHARIAAMAMMTLVTAMCMTVVTTHVRILQILTEWRVRRFAVPEVAHGTVLYATQSIKQTFSIFSQIVCLQQACVILKVSLSVAIWYDKIRFEDHLLFTADDPSTSREKKMHCPTPVHGLWYPSALFGDHDRSQQTPGISWSPTEHLNFFD
jgi:hypothetical protein